MEKIRADLLQKLKREMERADITFAENVPMSRYTSFKAGGNAAVLAEVRDTDRLRALLALTSQEGVPHILLGNGSNTLFKDSGYEGVVIKLSQDFAKVSVDPDSCTAAAGTAVLLSSLTRTLLEESITGFEFASGIPGSLGGALFMNAGAYGGEMKQVVKSVRAIAPDGGAERVFSAEEMDFGYRHSVLAENGYIAVEAVLSLEKGDKEKIAAKMKDLTAHRRCRT